MFLCSACVYCHLKKVKLRSFSGIAIMVKLFTQLLCLFSPTISGEVTALQTLFEVTWQRIACLVSTDSLLCATNSAHGATLCLHPWALMPVGYNIGIQELGKRAVTAGSLSLCVCVCEGSWAISAISWQESVVPASVLFFQLLEKPKII